MQDIILLLTQWEAYQKSTGGRDLGHFGQWLTQKSAAHYTTTKPEYEATPNAMVGFLMGSLMGYAEAWTKLAFKALPLTGFVDFGILKYIEEHRTPSKKSIADYCIAENSTIFESIKRLIKLGLVDEETDPKDRRVRRVKLSKKGKQITESATQSVLQLSDLLVGDLIEEEKQQLIGLLQKLNRFHEHLYQHMSREAVADTYINPKNR